MAARLQFHARIDPGDRNRLWYRFYARHRRRIYGLCLWMLADTETAIRLAQSVFIRCLRLVRNGLSPRELEAQLDRCVVARLRARTMDASRLRRLPAEAAGQACLLDEALPQTRLLAALQSLPPEPRLLLLLHDWQGYASEKVADLMGMETVRCRQSIFQARLRLRAQLLHN